jgi:MarR family 2-MHQ and catechol resistance regulon transcriptional repressor
LTELGEWQGVTKANMTGLVDRLERDGLVTRAKHPDDRRLTMVRATPKAIDCLAGLEQPHEEHMGRVLSCLNPEEQETLIQLLTRLRQSLGD